MKHTKGPWKIDENEMLPLAVIQDDEEGMGISEIGARTKTNIANANLIAAAPEMLEALEFISVYFNQPETKIMLQGLEDSDWCNHARLVAIEKTVEAVIKKAKGE